VRYDAALRRGSLWRTAAATLRCAQQRGQCHTAAAARSIAAAARRLRSALKRALSGRLISAESFGRRFRRWCDLDDRAGVVGHDAPPRLITAHRSHNERVGEPLVHELHLALDEIVLRAPRGKYDAWLVKTTRKMRGTSPRTCSKRHVRCASESSSGEEASGER
jgi:hypothetical protein